MCELVVPLGSWCSLCSGPALALERRFVPEPPRCSVVPAPVHGGWLDELASCVHPPRVSDPESRTLVERVPAQ